MVHIASSPLDIQRKSEFEPLYHFLLAERVITSYNTRVQYVPRVRVINR